MDRNFFGDKGFELQIYDMAEKIHSYEDYATGKLTKNELTAVSPKTKMQMLRRNRSKRVDVFLDWLVSRQPDSPFPLLIVS